MPRLEEILRFFAGYIEGELGIVYADHNFFQLQSRLEQISLLTGSAGFEDLYEKAKRGISGSLKQLLLDVATNNETYFFRDPRVFSAVESLAIPALAQSRAIRVWSGASSTGQEALSIAMMIEEWCLKNHQAPEYSIVGTDISQRALEKAKSGRYTQLEVQRGLPVPLLVKYFTKDLQDHWTAQPDLLAKIEYRSFNLLDPFPFVAPFDLIFLRNVLIYQSVDRKKAILEKVTRILRPGGFLVLGAGETLLGLSNGYEHAAPDGAIVYRKKSEEEEAQAA